MRNWTDHFGLIEVRRKHAENVWNDANRFVFLTAEVAMTIERYAALPPWEQATARAAAVALTVDSAVVVGSAADRVYVEHGMRVTRIHRTLRDVCCFEGLEAGVAAIDSARRKWPGLAVDKLRASMLAGPRFKGAPIVREAVVLSIPNSGSVRESQARLLLGAVAGVVTVEVQAEFIDRRTGERYYVDFLINGWLILEVDGDVKYDGVTYGKTDDIIREERRREKELQNQGKVVVRVTDPCEVPVVVAEALARLAHAAA